MDKQAIFNDLKKRMEGAIQSLKGDFQGLRTGRASPSLLESVVVDAYGGKMPLNQLASVSAPESRLLVVQVWDKGNVNLVSKGIAAADLGLNPAVDGTLVRVPIPPLSEERRKEMVGVVHKYAEQARIAIRNVRRDAMDAAKKLEKDHAISKDELHTYSEDIQKETDHFNKQVEELASKKEEEILQV